MNKKVNNNKNAYWKGLVNKPITKYKVMAIVGGIIFTIGVVLNFACLISVMVRTRGTTQNPKMNPTELALLITGLILWAGPGIALASVGIPCWIAMGVQQKVARKKLGINKK